MQQGDSKFASGFTNLVYTPLYNGLGGVHATTADVVNGGLLWSSGNLSNGSGTQAQPIPLAAFAARNPDAKIVQISFDNGGTSGAGSSASTDTDISIDQRRRRVRFDVHALRLRRLAAVDSHGRTGGARRGPSVYMDTVVAAQGEQGPRVASNTRPFAPA